MHSNIWIKLFIINFRYYRTNQLNKINIHHYKTKHNTNMKKRVTSEFKTSGAAWTTVDNWRGFAFVILNVLPETKHRDWSFSFEDNNGEEFEEREREGMNVAEREETAIETNSLKRKKERKKDCVVNKKIKNYPLFYFPFSIFFFLFFFGCYYFILFIGFEPQGILEMLPPPLGLVHTLQQSIWNQFYGAQVRLVMDL